MSTPLHSDDFPDWMGPMLVKELRQGLKARGFEATFIVLQVVLVVVLSYHALIYARYGAKFESQGLSGIFWAIVSIQLLLVTPIRAMGGLANERKANTLELIFMSGLSAWRITWGKWVSLQFQSVLFVLAVLPYGLLRYFFGGVNLTEDLTSLGWLVVGSAVFSAIGLAISGMPTFVRIGTVMLVLFFGLSAGVQLVFARFVSGSSGSSFSWDGGLPYFVYNVLLVGLGALQLGAASIAPVAENHAMRQRLIVFAAVAPIPLMKWTQVGDSSILFQYFLFGVTALILAWWHLATSPTALRVQIEPFSKRGALAYIVGLIFQPGWPGAVLFLLVSEGIVVALADVVSPGGEATGLRAGFLMAGAALLTPALLWRLLGGAPKQLLLKHSLILLACGGLMSFARIADRSADFAFGEQIWTALLPPFGFWAMLDKGYDPSNVTAWLLAGGAMLIGQAALLLLMARPYLKRMSEFHRSIKGSAVPSLAVGEVPA